MSFTLTQEQVLRLGEIFKVDTRDLEKYEIYELLDRLIDEGKINE